MTVRDHTPKSFAGMTDEQLADARAEYQKLLADIPWMIEMVQAINEKLRRRAEFRRRCQQE
jgi:hypothetical protein